MPATLGTKVIDKVVPKLDVVRSRIAAKVGHRPWRVYRERHVWSGAEVGVGARLVSLSQEVGTAPFSGGPPELVDERKRQLHPGGLRSGMKITLREVSLGYAEAELTGAPIAANEAWFFRIVEAEGQEAAPFYAQISDGCAAPRKDRDKTIGWILELLVVEAP
jgi:hypothetical protein